MASVVATPEVVVRPPREFGRGIVVVVCVLALLLGVALGVGNFVFAPRIPDLVPVCGLALPLSMLGVVACLPSLMFAAWSVWPALLGQRLERLRFAVSASSFAVFAFGLGTLAGWRVLERNAKDWLTDGVAYCDRLRPEIERYRGEHGTYPDDVDGLISGPRPMLALTGDVHYIGWSDRYELQVNTSRALGLVGAVFDSSKQSWHIDDKLGP